jgi:hypothetical protein
MPEDWVARQPSGYASLTSQPKPSHIETMKNGKMRHRSLFD